MATYKVLSYWCLPVHNPLPYTAGFHSSQWIIWPPLGRRPRKKLNFLRKFIFFLAFGQGVVKLLNNTSSCGGPRVASLPSCTVAAASSRCTGEAKLSGSGHRFPPVVAQHFDPVNLTCMNSLGSLQGDSGEGGRRRTKDNQFSNLECRPVMVLCIVLRQIGHKLCMFLTSLTNIPAVLRPPRLLQPGAGLLPGSWAEGGAGGGRWTWDKMWKISN